VTLVPLSAGQDGTPVYLVHPVGGSIFCYLGLARALGADHPCFGFASATPPSGEPDLPGLAASYAQQIDASARPVLAGWSVGGLIAFEMARHLPATTALVLIDAPAPGTAPANEDVPTTFASDLAAMTGRPQDAARVVAARPEDRQDALWELMRQQDPDLTQDDARRRVDTFRWHSAAFAAYQPGSGVDCSTVLVTADNRPEPWQPWLTGPVRAERLPSDHYGVLRAPVTGRVHALIEEAIGA
jgi:thioesterase domain-containing protein